MKKYVIGVDYGTLSARAIVVERATGRTLGECTFVYPHGVMDQTLPDGTPLNGFDWALAHPADYLEALRTIIPGAVRNADISSKEVGALAIAATACTLLPVDAALAPLCTRPEFANHPHAYLKLWKHHRAQAYADRMTEIAQAMDPSILDCYGGRISSEWAIPKSMEIYYEDPAVYSAADRFMQVSDWLTACLTGNAELQNGSIAQYKAMWSRRNGRPSEAYFTRISKEIPEIIHSKLRGQMLMAGECAGNLCRSAAEALGLSEETVVAMAHTDAHSGALGVGACDDGDYVFIIGTSSCGHLITKQTAFVPGVTGALSDGLLPGFTCYSAGQACVGDMLDWFITRAIPENYTAFAQKHGKNLHQTLEEMAAAQAPGECGLVALDWFNGNRSTLTNANLSGLLLGLTMETKPEDIYRALLDSISFGHREIVDNFLKHGLEIRRIILCGGIAHKNRLLLQIMADVLNRPLDVSSEPQATALGAAICAAAAMEKIPLADAIRRMRCGVRETIFPNPENAMRYEDIYGIYHQLYNFFGRERPDLMASLRGKHPSCRKDDKKC